MEIGRNVLLVENAISSRRIVIKFWYTVKKSFTSFPSPAGISLIKLPLGRNNSVMTSLFPPRESLVVTSWLGTGTRDPFFLYSVEAH
jgi:hypothetical protein